MRRTELKRTTAIKADPEKTRNWQRRSAKPLPARSSKRIEDAPARHELVRDVLAAQPMCEAQITFGCTSRTTEVNEIIRRSQWVEGFLVRFNTEALCHNCHAYITTHPEWAKRHGHQMDGATRDLDDFALLVADARRTRLDTHARCGPACKLDHREI